MAKLDRDTVTAALLDRAEELFRDLLGEPQRAASKDWRPKGNPSLSCAMRGERRGQWHDFATGEGGDLLELVAVHLCGLPKAASDFPKVLETAANWCGIAHGVVDRSELDRRCAAREAKAAAEDAEDARRKAEVVAAIYNRMKPVTGTPAEVYLRSRGITSFPSEVAFDPRDCALIVWSRDASGKRVTGQRIFLQRDGKRALDRNGKKREKIAFGSTSGFPAKFHAATSKPGPLYIAEGPETALTVWLATGAETWAVYGWTGFKPAPVPLNRRVIFCPDRDPVEGSAAKGFKEAVAHHFRAGVDAWVAIAPEDAGSKRDFNDTLQKAGIEAVRAALDAAVAEEVIEDPAQEGPKPSVIWPESNRRRDMEKSLPVADVAEVRGIALKLSDRVPVEMSVDDLFALIASHAPGVWEAHGDVIRSDVEKRIARAHRAAIAPVTLTDTGKHDFQVVDTLEPPSGPGVWIYKAPMGTGKTQLVAAPFASDRKNILAVVHRQSLTWELSRRLRTHHYQTPIEDVPDRLSLCSASLTKGTWAETLTAARGLVVDEFQQVLDFFGAEEFCDNSDGDARDNFAAFCGLMRRNDGEMTQVLLDAGFFDEGLAFLEKLRPDERFHIRHMLPKNEGIRARVIYSKKGRDGAVAEVRAEVMAGGKVWVAADSEQNAINAAEALERTGKRVLLITAATKEKAEQAALLRDPDGQSRLWDVVIASPVISSGLSIEHRDNPHFTLVVGLFCGESVSPMDARQMLRRVRYVRRMVIGIHLQTGYGSTTSARDVLRNAEAVSGAKGDLYDAVVAAEKARGINGRASFARWLWWQCEADGWAMERAKAKGDEEMAEISKANREALRTATINARAIDDAEAALLETVAVKTDEDRGTLRAYQIRKAYAVHHVTPDLLAFDDKGGKRKLRNFAALVGSEHYWRDQKKLSSVNVEDFARCRALLQAAFDGVDVFSDKPWLCEATAAALVEMWVEKGLLTSMMHFGLVGNRTDHKGKIKMPMRRLPVVKGLLKGCGLTFEKPVKASAKSVWKWIPPYKREAFSDIIGRVEAHPIALESIAVMRERLDCIEAAVKEQADARMVVPFPAPVAEEPVADVVPFPAQDLPEVAAPVPDEPVVADFVAARAAKADADFEREVAAAEFKRRMRDVLRNAAANRNRANDQVFFHDEVLIDKGPRTLDGKRRSLSDFERRFKAALHHAAKSGKPFMLSLAMPIDNAAPALMPDPVPEPRKLVWALKHPVADALPIVIPASYRCRYPVIEGQVQVAEDRVAVAAYQALCARVAWERQVVAEWFAHEPEMADYF